MKPKTPSMDWMELDDLELYKQMRTIDYADYETRLVRKPIDSFETEDDALNWFKQQGLECVEYRMTGRFYCWKVRV